MDYRSGEPRLEHVFDIRINFEHRWMWGPIHPDGPRHGFTSVQNGVIEGPRLNGRVVGGSGADFPVVRSDGVIELNAHYMLEADDGAQIYIRNVGYVVPPKDGQPAYFRATPYFRAPDGPYGWMNRTVFICGGERHPGPPGEGDHSIFRYWAVY